jgi:hypothetical protein
MRPPPAVIVVWRTTTETAVRRLEEASTGYVASSSIPGLPNQLFQPVRIDSRFDDMRA